MSPMPTFMHDKVQSSLALLLSRNLQSSDVSVTVEVHPERAEQQQPPRPWRMALQSFQNEPSSRDVYYAVNDKPPTTKTRFFLRSA